MNEQNKKNKGGLFDKDPFPKDVWEIAYKNTGGKPFEKGNAFTAADEKAKGGAQSNASKLTPEQQRLKSELKAKQEARKTSGQTKSTATTSYSTTFISGLDASEKATITPPTRPAFDDSRRNSTNYSTKPSYDSNEDEDEESDDLEALITKFLKKPFKEIEKALAGEEYDKTTVAISAVVIVLIIIVFGLLGS